MGAKPVLAALVFSAVVVAGGCANLHLARFAPPGLIKYEDIAGDQPANPQIQARIAERKAVTKSKTPNLSEQPQKVPTGMSANERTALTTELLGERDRLDAQVEKDRQAAEAEQGTEVSVSGQGAAPLSEAGEVLSRAIDRDTAAARKERSQPPPAPQTDADEQD